MRRKANFDVNDRQETSERDGREQSASLLPMPPRWCEMSTRSGWKVWTIHPQGYPEHAAILWSPYDTYYISPPTETMSATTHAIEQNERRPYASLEAAYMALRMLYPDL